MLLILLLHLTKGFEQFSLGEPAAGVETASYE